MTAILPATTDNALAERLARVGFPQDELDRHGLDFGSLRERPQECAPAVGRLVDSQAERAETVLARCRCRCRSLPELVAPEYRPFLNALISVQELRLDAVQRNRDIARPGTGGSEGVRVPEAGSGATCPRPRRARGPVAPTGAMRYIVVALWR
ncbi:hypothetical protein ACIHIX_38410 [Streptomyces sp. NPDC051913]|uniref:hypothetical protein n=1 Tax=Streptomyces sp. NPDC051913 TaxID=3365676 RepID=UPI0037D2FE1B